MSGWVNRAAAAGFAASAPDYDRGRPGYPAEAIEFLMAELELGRGSRVLDLAAGTGKLSRPLAGAGLEVLAVEPIPEMRALIGPPIDAVEGTAEDLPAADASFDAVTVGQAFHWFDGERALVEIHRVLRPGGGLALVWNRSADGDDVMAAVEEIIGPHRGETPHHRTGRWRGAFEATSLFGPLAEHRFANSQEVDADVLAMRFGSASFVASLPEEERRSIDERLRALARDGPVELNHVTEVFTCRRR